MKRAVRRNRRIKLKSRYRLFLLAAVAFLAISFPVGAASAPAKLVIAYAAMSPRVAPLWAAQELGFFTKTVSTPNWFLSAGRRLSSRP
jgi:ABC-type nitrate/sulfonate/bicarbonate transport system substrate-binding protein